MRPYTPEDGLFVEFDAAFRGSNPKEDSLSVARLLVSQNEDQGAPEQSAEQLGWPALRLNVALYALAEARNAKLFYAMGTGPWCCAWFDINQRTRRYVRENS